jgi:hypothetical protein
VRCNAISFDAMGLVIAGFIPILFIALVALVNASCPAIFTGPGTRFWLIMLTAAGTLTIVAGIIDRRGSRLASALGRAPAGLAAGLLVQPSSSIVFAVAIALAAVASPQRGTWERLVGAGLLGAFLVVGYTIAFSPLVLGEPTRC